MSIDSYPENWTAKDIAKDKRLRRVYGISLNTWWDIWFAQKGKCGVCSKLLDYTTANLDHEHGGLVRGLLCAYCNRYRVGRHKWPEIVEVYNYLSSPPASKGGYFEVPRRNRARRRKARNVRRA